MPDAGSLGARGPSQMRERPPRLAERGHVQDDRWVTESPPRGERLAREDGLVVLGLRFCSSCS